MAKPTSELEARIITLACGTPPQRKKEKPF
jgi:hypothetical protein